MRDGPTHCRNSELTEIEKPLPAVLSRPIHANTACLRFAAPYCDLQLSKKIHGETEFSIKREMKSSQNFHDVQATAAARTDCQTGPQHATLPTACALPGVEQRPRFKGVLLVQAVISRHTLPRWKAWMTRLREQWEQAKPHTAGTRTAPRGPPLPIATKKFGWHKN